MNERSAAIFAELYERHPRLRVCEAGIVESFEMLVRTFRCGGKLILCGNGGSAADCSHIVGELMKGFCLERAVPSDEALAIARAAAPLGIDGQRLADSLQGGLPAVTLTESSALLTAFSNDRVPQYSFAQQVYVLGAAGDALLAISTSGNSENVLAACAVAKARGVGVVALSGGDGGRLSAAADACVLVPEREAFKVQELHLPFYHALCLALEAEFFEE